MKLLILSLILAVSAGTAFSSPPQDKTQPPDPFIRENDQKRAQNPAGLIFTIRLKDNQTRFRQGEVVRLELNFSSSAAKTFLLNTASYDRSGRLEIDSFVLDHRDGTADPLYDYFNSAMFGFMGGGLRGIGELSDKPQVMTSELNEWIRFDRPGHYRLYVVSGRVGTKRAPDDRYGSRSTATVSNVIEFDILPADDKWARQTINEAKAVLGKPDGDHRAACRTLRFLGTMDAATEMVRLLRGSDNNCDFESSFGLISSPHRDFVIRAMERAISLPEQPVATSLVRTLSLLAFTTQLPAPPPYPEGDDARIKEWQALMEQRRHSYEEVVLNYLRQLLAAVPQKQDGARAVSLQTLLDYQESLKSGESTQFRNLLAMMPEVFDRLPLDAQIRLLTYQWKPMARSAMLPVLRQTYERREISKDQYQERELRSIALRRIFELAPEEGRRLLLDEIRRLKPRVNQKALRSLPDETLPELDDVLVTNLEESRQPNGSADTETISDLIERYASAGILPRVLTVYEAPGTGRWACSIQASLLAYILKSDSATGGELLKKALAARGKEFTRCYPSVLTDVARLHMSAEMEEAASTVLEEDDPEMVAQATSVLGQFGSANAEEKLWQRLERWHEKMESHAAELRKQHRGVPAHGASSLSGEVMIEQELFKALSQGQAWLSDPEKLKRLRALCLTDDSRNQIDSMIRAWNRRIEIGLSPFEDQPYLVGVAHYQLFSLESLKEKLLQFPRGTVFIWGRRGGGVDESRARQIFVQLKNYLEEHGMKLEEEKAQ
ncbi:MAG: hypothetical protein ND895_11505 [Pyrinomonadaceae bacterium]|nr:hypothetical protein [Pyrinomonadaceae bacterium]